MQGAFTGFGLLMVASSASATDFGIRTVPSSSAIYSPGHVVSGSLSVPSRSGAASTFTLRQVTSIGSRFGRVTSTIRSRARNRAVGGVPNSWHLSGRAVDIARAPGVSHVQIADAYRSAGFRLIESLDEGDHSHFAFAADIGRGPNLVQAPSNPSPSSSEPLTFRVVPARDSVGF